MKLDWQRVCTSPNIGYVLQLTDIASCGTQFYSLFSSQLSIPLSPGIRTALNAWRWYDRNLKTDKSYQIRSLYYYASRGYIGGNPLSYHSVACGSWSSRGVAWQIQRYTCTRRSM